MPEHLSEQQLGATTNVSSATIGDDVLLSDFADFEETSRSSGSEAAPVVSRNPETPEVPEVPEISDVRTGNDSTARRDERMNDEWWVDPSKPKVEPIQTVDNSKLMEVRVLPPKEFLEQMQVEGNLSPRQDRALPEVRAQAPTRQEFIGARHSHRQVEPMYDQVQVEPEVDRGLAEPMQYRVQISPQQDRAKIDLLQERVSRLNKQSRALDEEEDEPQPKLTREILLKILSSFRTTKSSQLAKILADHNIKIELQNLKVK